MRWLSFPLCTLFASASIVLSTAASALVTVGALYLPGAIDIEVVGQFAYVVDGYSGFSVIDVSNSAEPVRVSSFSTALPPSSAAVAEGLLYLAVDGRLERLDTGRIEVERPTLRVVDVSNPLAPVEVGAIELKLDGHLWGLHTSDVAVADGHAYVASGFGLMIIDVSNPNEPVEVAALETAAIGLPNDIAVMGNRVYLAYQSNFGMSGLRIIDVSNPAVPVELGAYEFDGAATGAAVAGNLACVTVVANFNSDPNGPLSTLRVFDVSNAAAPIEVGAVETPGMARDVEVVGSLAYVADGTGLRIVDISDPTLPVDIGGLGTPSGWDWLNDVVVVDGLAYVANGADIRVIDLSKVAFPREAGTLATPGMPRDVEVANDRAYLLDVLNEKLRIIDVSNPAVPTELSTLDVGSPVDVEVADELVYVATRSYGPSGENVLRMIDASDPSAPFELASLSLPSMIFDFEVAGGIAYVATSRPASLRIVDVSDVASPREVGSVDFASSSAQVRAISVAGEFVYVGAYEWVSPGHRRYILRVIDVSDPAAPFEIGSLAYPADLGEAQALGVMDGIAYYTFWNPVGGFGLHAIDVTNPNAPIEVGHIPMPNEVVDLEVSDGLVHVATRQSGTRVIDVSDPRKPFELGAFSPRGDARGIAVANGLSYVTDDDANMLRIIDFGPEYAQALSVDLDTKPGSDSNPVNFSIQGVVPVAILGSSEFDVADVDATTLVFGPSDAAPDHSHGPHVEDVNGDDFPDLLSHFRTDETGISFGDRTACLTGEMLDGTPLSGCDAVRTVPDKDGDGLLDEQEVNLGTHDLNPDSDGDGIQDGEEVLVLRTDPLDALDPTPAPVQQPKRRGRRRR